MLILTNLDSRVARFQGIQGVLRIAVVSKYSTCEYRYNHLRAILDILFVNEHALEIRDIATPQLMQKVKGASAGAILTVRIYHILD